MATKISIVEYLNSVPLAWGVLEGAQREMFEPFLDTPAECADRLLQGSVDIGLIPSIEYQRIKGTRIVQGPAIASRHRVKSVLLVSELPLWKVRTVAHDKGSRTSVALAKILLKEFYRTKPDFRPAEPDIANMLATSDAALIIGDAALRFMEQQEIPRIENQRSLVRHGAEPLQIFDLQERWKFLTGLPFLFAFWAVRGGFKDASVVAALNESRDFGVAAIPAIADRYAEKLQLKQDFVESYLRDNVYYYMDNDCLEALGLFYEKAAEVGAIKSVRGMDFL